MRTIRTFYHGVLDYSSAVILLLLPNLIGFAHIGGGAAWLPRVAGVTVLLQGLTTKYELGLYKIIYMRTHLMNDYVLSLLLAISPWLFGFYKTGVWLPHFVMGVLLFGGAMLTKQNAPTRAMA